MLNRKHDDKIRNVPKGVSLIKLSALYAEGHRFESPWLHLKENPVNNFYFGGLKEPRF